MAAPADRAGQIIDIHFTDLVTDPIAAVKRIYARFNYPYCAAFEEEMVRYLEAQRAVPKSRHAYTAEQFGLSRQLILDRSADYLAWVQSRCGEVAAAAIAT
jgi:hypothetical protein